MDELFTLVFILLIVLATIFDAMARNKRKRQQKEQMEREEAEAGAGAGARNRGEAGRRGEAQGRPTQAHRRPEGGVATEEEERETADKMVPEDLWAILTGQAPGGETRRAPPEAPRREPEPAPREEREVPGPPNELVEPPRQPEIPHPVPQDRMATRLPEPTRTEAPPPDATGAPATRRSDRWMDGLGRGAPSEIEEEEARIYELPEEPWDQFEDIAAGEIREGEGVRGEIGEEEDLPAQRRRRIRRGRGARYTQLLDTGELDDLRAGIVLKEVLGPPAAFNEPGPDWG